MWTAILNHDLITGFIVAISLHAGVGWWTMATHIAAPEDRIEKMLARIVHQEVNLPKPKPPPSKVAPKPEPKPEAEKPKPKPKPKPKAKPKRRKAQPKQKPKAKKPASEPSEPLPLVLSKTYGAPGGSDGVVVESGEEDILGDSAVDPTERNTNPAVVEDPGTEDEEPKLVIVHARPKARCEVQWPAGAPRMRRIVEVTLQLVIDRRGKVIRTRVLRSGGEPFDSTAQEALRKCVFLPGKRNGVRFVDRVPFVVEFKPSSDS
jgi:TonB family protein